MFGQDPVQFKRLLHFLIGLIDIISVPIDQRQWLAVEG